ncbi:DUF1266 domain-containing protein [Myxococcus landrumensis]|uniref:DUF1266 domain-containing protein n=1 Tax=Myxococcus landrumensis TaxID=2813577 RepID=A0ABX7NB91_9BACT|nr:DUF1266 domain-containing protein [Myxococcus landrumus]QSQ16046.1 DUF1266 domain-containing protein [Myxococcus landrumus]
MNGNHIILLVVVLGIALYWLPKILFFVRTLKSFLTNPKVNLPPQQLFGILLGAVNAEQITAYWNSLETGVPTMRLRTGLSEWWGVYNGQTAAAQVEKLLSAGHRVAFDAALGQLANVSPEQWEQVAKSGGEALSNLGASLASLKEDKTTFTAEDLARGTLAWDLGRAVVVTRMSYDLKFLDESQAWAFIARASEQARAQFSSWEQWGKSYLLGRAMWNSSEDGMLSGLASITADCQATPDGPWTKLAWQTESAQGSGHASKVGT